MLPENLLPRLITRTYPLSVGQARWRGGVVLSMEGARALVRANAEDAEINVTLIGDEDGRNRLVKLIRNHFQHLHRDIQGLNPKELVEVKGHRGVYKSVKVLEIDELKSKVKTVVTTVESDKGSLSIDQTRELNRVMVPGPRGIVRRTERTGKRDDTKSRRQTEKSWRHHHREPRRNMSPWTLDGNGTPNLGRAI